MMDSRKYFLLMNWKVMTTDEGMSGQGGVEESLLDQGMWLSEERKLTINILEIQAIQLTLLDWSVYLEGLPIRVSWKVV